MIGEAPASFAPMIALSPTPPSPNTATDWPGATLAVFVTAPTPVRIAQPKSAAAWSGTEESILISDSWAATVNCEKPETPKWCSTREAPLWKRTPPPSRVPTPLEAALRSQRADRKSVVYGKSVDLGG